MKNKKVLIISIVVAVVLVIAVVVGILVVKPFDKEDDEKDNDKKTSQTDEKKDDDNKEDDEKEKDDEKDVDNGYIDEDGHNYKELLEDFAKACVDEESMRQYVNNNVDLKSLWAQQNVESAKEFPKMYNSADPKDYEAAEFVEQIETQYLKYVTDGELVISNVKITGDMSKIGIDFWKTIKFDVAIDGVKEEEEYGAVFAYGKLVIVTPYLSIEALLGENDESNKDDELSNQEKKTFNAKFEAYEGEQKGSDVKLLLEEVINSNKNSDIYVSVTTYIDSYDNSDLIEANQKKDANALAKTLKDLSNNISSGKTYQVDVFTNPEGFTDDIWIEEK